MWIIAAGQTPFEQIFGPMSTFVRQPAPAAISLLGTVVAFICLLWSVVNSFFHSSDEDWRPKVTAFVKAFVVVALIAHSGDLINAIRRGVDQAYNAAGAPGEGIRQVLDDIRDNNTAAEQDRNQPAPSSVDLWGQMKATFNSLCYTLGRGLTMAVWVIVWVVRLLQDMFIVMLYVLLPLAFGLAVTPWFSSVGTSLISSLIGVLFWPVGFLMVDTFILAVLKTVLNALNNYGHQMAAAESGLSGIFWFLGAVNDIGFGVNLLLIGIVMLFLTAIGYYASTKVITSLFGAAGGAIASGIGALGKAAGVPVSAAALGTGAAAYAAGGALSGLSSMGSAPNTPTVAHDAGNPGPGAGNHQDIASRGLGSPQGSAAASALVSGGLGSGPSGSNASVASGADSGGGPNAAVALSGGASAPPRRSLARLQMAGETMQRAGVAMVAGGVSRTMRQAIKHSAANALVDGALNYKPSRRRLQDLEDGD